MGKDLYEVFCRVVKTKDQVRREEPMKDHTTFRIGGPARYFVSPGNVEELKAILSVCRQEGCPWFILGNGSNLLVSDKGFDGVVVEMGKGFAQVGTEGCQLNAGAGALLSRIARQALEKELTGLEFAAGIPGTLGGAVVMNAGAYGLEMKDVLQSVWVLDGDNREWEIPVRDLELGYRTSCIRRKGYVVLGAQFHLAAGKWEKIHGRMEELAAARRKKQPLEYPSAGSTFKRPEGHFAGCLIEEAGLKGHQVGNAQVSTKHCGFVVNLGGASAADVMELCRQVSERVKSQSGVGLEMEIRTLGEF